MGGGGTYEPMNERARCIVSGRVQGVFFRAFTQQVASSLGLRGWVRNLPDGRVEALFEGERAVVEEALAQCRRGPPAARVDAVDVAWEEGGGEPDGFRIECK